jgi:hypothetical protein
MMRHEAEGPHLLACCPGPMRTINHAGNNLPWSLRCRERGPRRNQLSSRRRPPARVDAAPLEYECFQFTINGAGRRPARPRARPAARDTRRARGDRGCPEGCRDQRQPPGRVGGENPGRASRAAHQPHQPGQPGRATQGRRPERRPRRNRGLCISHRQRWRGSGRPDLAEFTATAEPGWHGHLPLSSWGIAGCNYGPMARGMCQRHAGGGTRWGC